MEYQIRDATSDEEILSTWPVMQQLRPHHSAESYMQAVRRMMDSSTHRVASLTDDGIVRGVAGYRYMEMLYCGRILYVDDLSVDGEQRSKGYGTALIDWLNERARENDCTEIHLDSGVQREQAHKFYFREKFTINAYHFRRASKRSREI